MSVTYLYAELWIQRAEALDRRALTRCTEAQEQRAMTRYIDEDNHTYIMYEGMKCTVCNGICYHRMIQECPRTSRSLRASVYNHYSSCALSDRPYRLQVHPIVIVIQHKQMNALETKVDDDGTSVYLPISTTRVHPQ